MKILFRRIRYKFFYIKLRKRKKEKLKDIIIDYIYHYSNNQKVEVFESSKGTLAAAKDKRLNDDPELDILVKSIKKLGYSFKQGYRERDAEYSLLWQKENLFHAELAEKLHFQGYNTSTFFMIEFKEVVKFLEFRSYIVADTPVVEWFKYKLTTKGLNHYLTGASFEDTYLNRIALRNSFWIGIISAIAAAASAIVALYASLPENMK